MVRRGWRSGGSRGGCEKSAEEETLLRFCTLLFAHARDSLSRAHPEKGKFWRTKLGGCHSFSFERSCLNCRKVEIRV